MEKLNLKKPECINRILCCLLADVVELVCFMHSMSRLLQSALQVGRDVQVWVCTCVTSKVNFEIKQFVVLKA